MKEAIRWGWGADPLTRERMREARKPPLLTPEGAQRGVRTATWGKREVISMKIRVTRVQFLKHVERDRENGTFQKPTMSRGQANSLGTKDRKRSQTQRETRCPERA